MWARWTLLQTLWLCALTFDCFALHIGTYESLESGRVRHVTTFGDYGSGVLCEPRLRIRMVVRQKWCQ